MTLTNDTKENDTIIFNSIKNLTDFIDSLEEKSEATKKSLNLLLKCQPYIQECPFSIGCLYRLEGGLVCVDLQNRHLILKVKFFPSNKVSYTLIDTKDSDAGSWTVSGWAKFTKYEENCAYIKKLLGFLRS